MESVVTIWLSLKEAMKNILVMSCLGHELVEESF
jgi:hypothetical protein